MSKDAYYFPHDANSKQDPKLLRLIMKMGMLGYGIYWSILEDLRGMNNYEYSLNDIDSIAFNARCEAKDAGAVVKDFNLFIIDPKTKVFYSGSLRRRMKKLEERREKLSIAGKKGATIRHGLGTSDSPAKATPKQPLGSKVKQSKVKQSKEKKKKGESPPKKSFGENSLVLLTPPEEEMLLKRLAGRAGLAKYVEALNGWLAEDRKRHKENHYQTILNWARKDGNLKDAKEADGLSEAERKISDIIKNKKGLSSKDQIVDLLFEFPFNRDFIKSKFDQQLFELADAEVDKITEENRAKFGDIIKKVNK